MCEFCDDLRLSVDIRYDGTVNNAFRVRHEYKAALIEETYRDFFDGTSNRAGTSTGAGCLLNYCPECGRKFTKEDFEK